MQQIETSRFGTISIDEKTVINFVSPILGFDDVSQYVLLDHLPESPFKWLQAVQKPELAFVVTHPRFFNLDYEFTIPEEAADLLEATKPEDILVLTIVNIPSDKPSEMTANLLAPIVVNENALKAMQLILQDKNLDTRARLLSNDAASADQSAGQMVLKPVRE